MGAYAVCHTLRIAMRRLISLIAACILTTSLAACDGTNKTAYAPIESSEVLLMAILKV